MARRDGAVWARLVQKPRISCRRPVEVLDADEGSPDDMIRAAIPFIDRLIGAGTMMAVADQLTFELTGVRSAKFQPVTHSPPLRGRRLGIAVTGARRSSWPSRARFLEASSVCRARNGARTAKTTTDHAADARSDSSTWQMPAQTDGVLVTSASAGYLCQG